MRETKTNNNVTYDCTYHLVWCSKYRRRVLTSDDPSVENTPLAGDPGAVDVRLKEIVREVCEETGNALVEIEVMPDHVHALIECDPQYGVAKLARRIKGRTSRLLREEFPSLRRRLPTLWTNSYFLATTGDAGIETIRRYIENQRNV